MWILLYLVNTKNRVAAASEDLGSGTRMPSGHSLPLAFPALCTSALFISLPICCLCFSGSHNKKVIGKLWVFVVQHYVPERDGMTLSIPFPKS